MNKLRMDTYSRIVIVVLCLGAAAQPPSRQPQLGQLSGHVRDELGASIARASVFVRKKTSSEDEVRLVTHANVNGDFALILPEGGYDVLVTSPGFAANVQTISVLRRKGRSIDWTLKALRCDFPGMNCDTFQ